MVPGVPLHPANRGGICGGTFGDIGLRGASMDKLTATAIRNAKPADKPVRLFDGRGLYLEVTPTGRRYWRLKYRYAGKEKRLALGVYPEVTLAEARTYRDDARRQLREGRDPSAARPPERPQAKLAAAPTPEARAHASRATPKRKRAPPPYNNTRTI